MPKIADLFAAISLKIDKASFKQGRDELGRFTKRQTTLLGKAQKALSSQFEGIVTGKQISNLRHRSIP